MAAGLLASFFGSEMEICRDSEDAREDTLEAAFEAGFPPGAGCIGVKELATPGPGSGRSVIVLGLAGASEESKKSSAESIWS